MEKITSGGLPHKDNPSHLINKRLITPVSDNKKQKKKGSPGGYSGPSLRYEQMPDDMSDL